MVQYGNKSDINDVNYEDNSNCVKGDKKYDFV